VGFLTGINPIYDYNFKNACIWDKWTELVTGNSVEVRISGISKIKSIFYVCAIAILLSGAINYAQQKVDEYFTGQDLHLNAQNMIVCKDASFGPGTNILIFDQGFSLAVGANKFSSNKAVVWIDTVKSEYLGQTDTDYNCRVYLQEAVKVKQGALSRSTDVEQLVLDNGEALVANFVVSGQVFATAAQQSVSFSPDFRQLELYQNAVSAASPVRKGPVIAKEAVVPSFEEYQGYKVPEVVGTPGAPVQPEKQRWRIADIFKLKLPNIPQLPEPEPEPEPEPLAKLNFDYPVNLSGVWGVTPDIEKTTADGKNIATIIGRFYLWQRKDEKGNLIEFQADNAVIFYSSEDSFTLEQSSSAGSSFASGSMEAIYLQGNIVMTEGARTIRAEEAYYDFRKSQALVLKAEMKNFDTARGLPVYLRAEQLKQVSETVFHADEIGLKSSEFYLPQVSSTASKIVLTDTTAIDARTGEATKDSSYDGVLYDMRMKYGQRSVFRWPKMRTNFSRPDIPLKSVEVSRDSEFGTSVETRWYLAKLLGRKEAEGVDSTFAADYFGKRGAGAGVDIEYQKANYFGNLKAYVLHDKSGEDDLGRNRKNTDAGQKIRGRFRFQHRHYLPYDWQATVEVSYSSDINFIEWFHKNEFDVGKGQETVLHLKRIKDNWGFSILNKVRITDHRSLTEELPTIEYHLKGQSLWDHKLTFYSDSRVSRLRDLYGSQNKTTAPQQFYTFASTRNEIDMPFSWKKLKVTPFLAGTFAQEDQGGYTRDVDNNVKSSKEKVWLGEAGVRLATMFFKQNNDIKSKFWDINGIRHIVKPHLEAVVFYSGDDTAESRDMINLGVSQRWQTRRGKKGNLRNLDWMRLDIDSTWVSDDASSNTGPQNSYGPGKYIWNDPGIPIFDRKRTSYFGMVRDSINADYTWRVSDTTTILSDLNYDVTSSVVQQFDIGVSRYVYPNLTFYVGNRYLRPVITPNANGFEKGSSALVSAVSYALNSRYTLMVAQEYNFDFGKNVKSSIGILRKYHRMYYALSASSDKSLDRESIVFSMWPEGVKELAFGERNYVGTSRLSSEEY
jgi:lipopolysaccharide transport LptD-like protein